MVTGKDIDEFLLHLSKEIKTPDSEIKLQEALDKTEGIVRMIAVDLTNIQASDTSQDEDIVGDSGNHSEKHKDKNKRLPNWALELRIALRTVIQSREVGGKEKSTAIRIVEVLLEEFGEEFVHSDPEFLVVVCHLVTAELRIILDCPPDVFSDVLSLVGYCGIAEKAMVLLEDPKTTLNDTYAIKIATTTQEFVNFSLEYLVKSKEEYIQVVPSILFPLYRVICAFLAQGGGEILPSNTLKSGVSILVDSASIAMNNSTEFDAVGMLLPGLSHLSAQMIPNKTFKVLLDYLKLKWIDWRKETHPAKKKTQFELSSVLSLDSAATPIESVCSVTVTLIPEQLQKQFCREYLSFLDEALDTFSDSERKSNSFVSVEIHIASLMLRILSGTTYGRSTVTAHSLTKSLDSIRVSPKLEVWKKLSDTTKDLWLMAMKDCAQLWSYMKRLEDPSLMEYLNTWKQDMETHLQRKTMEEGEVEDRVVHGFGVVVEAISGEETRVDSDHMDSDSYEGPKIVEIS